MKIKYGVLRHMLSNRLYIGEYTYGDIVVKDVVPPIVDNDLFYRVQERISLLSQSHLSTNKYWHNVLHLKLHCGLCGEAMIIDSGTGHHGNIYRYYSCRNNKYSKGCTCARISKDEIEGIVIGCIIENCLTPHFIDNFVRSLYSAAKEENPFIMALNKKLESINNELQAIDKRINSDGELSQKARERYADLQELHGIIAASIEQLKSQQTSFSKPEIRYALTKLCLESNICKRALADAFLTTAIVYDNKVEIQLKHPKNSLTFPLAPRGNLGKRKN